MRIGTGWEAEMGQTRDQRSFGAERRAIKPATVEAAILGGERRRRDGDKEWERRGGFKEESV